MPIRAQDPIITTADQSNPVPSLPFPVATDGPEDEELGPRRSGFSPMSAIWLAIILGGSILQTCGR